MQCEHELEDSGFCKQSLQESLVVMVSKNRKVALGLRSVFRYTKTFEYMITFVKFSVEKLVPEGKGTTGMVVVEVRLFCQGRTCLRCGRGFIHSITRCRSGCYVLDSKSGSLPPH